MAPIIISNQPRTIVITPGMFGEDENKHIIESGELPKYAVGLFESNGAGPRKRKRLTHLTAEEKIMRRKLKNRVAAQTARDRKKARLETLEDAVTKIHEQTKKLLDVNSQLLERTEALESENKVLRERLGLDKIESFTRDKKKELTSIKHEFNDIVMTQNYLNSERISGESSDDEGYCILTPYEGGDVSVSDESCTESFKCEASKCVSPVPAAFGERIKERLNPQQQEAVKSVKLIRLQANQKEESTQLQSSTPTLQPSRLIQNSMIFSDNWKPSNHQNITIKKEMPLDLRTV